MSSQKNPDSIDDANAISADELHDLVCSLQEEIASGAIKIPPGSMTEASLKRVRLDAAGRVDPKSVDSSVRAASYAAAAARAQREMRRIPLRDAQAEYFEILDRFFGKPFSEMKKHRVTAVQVAQQLASSKNVVDAFTNELEEFKSGIEEFWGYYAPVVETHLADLKCLKSAYGGDVFPSYANNIACSVGLYVDTLILPDPLLRLLNFAAFMEPNYACFMVTKHALSAMGYRDLALAEVQPPIVVIAADPMLTEETYTKLLQSTSIQDVLEHCRLMFDRKFSSVSELQGFLKQLPTIEALTSKLADPRRFLFDSDWSDSPAAQFERWKKETTTNMPATVSGSTGEDVYQAFLGRMMQSNDLLLRSARYRANPVVEAPTSWQYLLWKYEYDSKNSGTSVPGRELVITKAIEAEGSEDFGMLSGVPPEALLELRRIGAMEELRQTIHEGINKIDYASPSALPQIANAVVENLDRAFEKHSRELKSSGTARRKFFGVDVSRWIVGGGVSLAAALTHNPAVAAIGAISPWVLGAPSIPDLQKRWKELTAERQRVQRSPVAVLFRHLGDKFGFSRN